MLGRLRPRLTYANVISTVCLFIVLGGAAYAATSFIQSNGTIRGCVSKTGQLTVLKKGKSKCKKGQTKIAWNQVGKTGAPGQQGVKGDTGPPGPATGPAGGDLTGNYPDPTIKPNAVSGADIDESTLGQVPSAANAAQLGGLAPSAFFPSSNVKKFDRKIVEMSSLPQSAQLLDMNGYLLVMDCEDTGSTHRLTLRSSGIEANRVIEVLFGHGDPATMHQGDFAVPTTSAVSIGEVQRSTATGESGAGLLVYRDDTQVISIPFRYTIDHPSDTCEVSGTATRAG